jgi:hypothetical protein
MHINFAHQKTTFKSQPSARDQYSVQLRQVSALKPGQLQCPALTSQYIETRTSTVSSLVKPVHRNQDRYSVQLRQVSTLKPGPVQCPASTSQYIETRTSAVSSFDKSVHRNQDQYSVQLRQVSTSKPGSIQCPERCAHLPQCLARSREGFVLEVHELTLQLQALLTAKFIW